MTRKRTKFSYALMGLLVILLIGRLALPTFVISYVNKTLDEIPGYQGSISDVDISLWRGAYTIDSLILQSTEGDVPQPFVFIPVMELSVQWGALLDGAIVGEIEAEGAELHFVSGKTEGEDEYGEGVDWTEPIKELIPLQINRLEVSSGTIFYHDYGSNPEIQLDIRQLDLLVTNLSNASLQDSLLPSHIQLSGISIGEGKLNIEGRMNALKQTPDLDLDITFEGVALPALNDFLRAYGKVDAESGVFSLYAELLVKDSQVEGYLKPIIQHLSIVSWKEDRGKPLQLVWESISGFLSEVFSNQPQDQFATRVPISGSLQNVKTHLLPSVWNIFRNAFFGAFQSKVDGSISLEKELERKN
jgi:hypothetical protein